MTEAESCPRCRRRVWAGPDADTGLPRVLDPRPLSALGEALARLAGRGTFTRRRIGGRVEIAYRDKFRIRGSPAGSPRIDVLVEHDCELTAIDPLPRIRSAVFLPVDDKPDQIDPPF